MNIAAEAASPGARAGNDADAAAAGEPQPSSAAPSAERRSQAWKAHSADSTASGIQSALGQKLRAALAAHAGRTDLNPTARAAVARAQGQADKIRVPQRNLGSVNAPARPFLGQLTRPGADDGRMVEGLAGKLGDPMREIEAGRGRDLGGADPLRGPGMPQPGSFGPGRAAGIGLGDAPSKIGAGAPDLAGFGRTPPEQPNTPGSPSGRKPSPGVDPNLAAGGGRSVRSDLNASVARAKAESMARRASGAAAPPLSSVVFGIKQVMQQLDIGDGEFGDSILGSIVRSEAQEKFPGTDVGSAMKRTRYVEERGEEPTSADQTRVDEAAEEVIGEDDTQADPAGATDPAAEGPEESTAPKGDVGDTTDKTPNPEDGGIDTPASRAAMARFQAAFGARAQQRTAGRESLIDPGPDGGTAGGDAEQLGGSRNVQDFDTLIHTVDGGESPEAPPTLVEEGIEDLRDSMEGPKIGTPTGSGPTPPGI